METLPIVSKPPPLSSSGGPCRSAYDDLLSYLQEYISPFYTPPIPEATSRLFDESVAGGDVVVFAKVGCGYCERLKGRLAEMNEGGAELVRKEEGGKGEGDTRT